MPAPGPDPNLRIMEGAGATAHCPRCDQEVRVDRPWGGWVWARRAWFAVLAVFLMLFPFMSADYVCMIPTFMLVVFASGPLFHLAGLKATCRRCRLELDART